jgi:dehydrogenase/reductase SDR family protein 7B
MSPFASRANRTFFTGKTVWITGASSGIGAELSRELAKCGAQLILSARRKDILDEVRNSCHNSENHHIVVLDLESQDSIDTAVQLVHEERVSVDILINNAGVSQRSLALHTDDEVLRRLFEVNTLGPIMLTQAVLPKMLKAHGGQIVVVSSVLGRIGMPMRAGYSASKHALHGYFESLRLELFDQNIRFTVVCPGFVNTNISQNALRSNGPSNSLQSTMQESGISASRCAHQIVNAVRRQKVEFLVGGLDTLIVPLFRFFPSLVRRLFRTNIFLKKGENND